MSREQPGQGVLFDMDGVLVLTEHLKAEAHAAAVRAFGGELSAAYYKRIMGRSREAARAAFIAEAGLSVDPRAYAEVYDREFRSRLETRRQVAAGVPALLQHLSGKGYALALVTSSVRWMLDEVMQKTGLSVFFQAKICAEDVKRPKPAADPYLQAARTLGLPRRTGVVIEDSETGIAAARAAQLPVIAVRHTFNGLHDFSGADAVVASLENAADMLDLVQELGAGKKTK